MDQRTKITKLMIRKALTELLGEKPIQSISVKELCERAGINRGTFYSHYQDLYDLQTQVEEEMLRDFAEAMRPLLDGPQEDLTPLKITTGIFRCLKENADLCIVTLGPFGDKRFATKLLTIGRENCVGCYSKYFEGATREQLEYYYAFVSSGCIGLLEKWLSDGMATPAEEIARVAEDIMMKGIHFLR